MKKWIVIFSALILAAPTMGADWEFSGSMRMATFWNYNNYGDFEVNGQDDNSDLIWNFQNNSRLEAKVKAEKVKGHIELGLKGTNGGDSPGLRHLEVYGRRLADGR